MMEESPVLSFQWLEQLPGTLNHSAISMLEMKIEEEKTPNLQRQAHIKLHPDIVSHLVSWPKVLDPEIVAER